MYSILQNVFYRFVVLVKLYINFISFNVNVKPILLIRLWYTFFNV